MERPSLKPVGLLVVVLLLRAAAMAFPSLPVESPDAPAPVPVIATAATFYYEKDDTGPPSPPIMSGLNRLNREKKITATTFEEDTKDGSGEVPDQYKVGLAAAQSAGLPALVTTSGDTVLKVIKAPTTEQQVVEACP